MIKRHKAGIQQKLLKKRRLSEQSTSYKLQESTNSCKTEKMHKVDCHRAT